MYSSEIKEKAKNMRLSGSSYTVITKELGIPKSTLSTWFAKTLPSPFTKEVQYQHLKRIRKLAAKARSENARLRREKILREVKEKVVIQLTNYDLERRDVKMALLAALYWAEGTKHKGVSGPIFVNTDPKLLLLYITLFRELFEVDESKFRLRVHIHHYHDEKKVAKYWTDLLQISMDQLAQPLWVKPRSKTKKFRRNFMGICFVSYLDSRITKEIMETAYQIYDKLVA